MLPDVLTDMRGHCLYLGSHPGTSDGLSEAVIFHTSWNIEVLSITVSVCICGSASHDLYLQGGPILSALSQRKYVM